MKFTKMQGAGNDYVYMYCMEDKIADIPSLAKKISDRHFGVGSDGLVFIEKSNTCDFRMRMFNSDGSEAEMCGNASRCVAKYVYERGYTSKKVFTLETKAGVKILNVNLDNHGLVKSVTVDMGSPILEPQLIPVEAHAVNGIVDIPICINNVGRVFTCVSMGNPHAVTFVDDVAHFDVEKEGSFVETYCKFPSRTNVEFVQVISRTELKMRVWERGAGETLACGTGACASIVATVQNNYCDREVVMHLLGGDLFLKWDEKDGHVYMTGPAEFICDGDFFE